MGRRTQDRSRTYSWDLASHLKSFTEAGKTVQCDYDTLGVLISLTADAGTQQYVWNHATPLPTVGVIRQGGVDQRYFVHTPTGELLYSIDAATGARSFYHFDEQGNTVLLTNDAGDVTDRYAYSPDGSLVAVSGATPNPFTFAGRYGVVRLGSANLYAMGTRIYDSATASFLSKDPVFHLDPRQINPYQYAIGNPLAYLNVSGEGLLSITGNETTDILAGGRRNPGIGGFRVGRNENLFETYDEMVSQEEILSYQTIDREYQDLNRLRLLNKSNSVGNLWKNTDLLGQGVVQLRAALTESHLFVGDRQAVEESLDGSRPVLTFYSAASRDAQKLYKDKIITDLQRQFLVFQIRHTLDDILLLPQGSDETSLLLDLNLYPKTSLLPFILEGQK
ncbi:MAG: RHS repeat-associated core domain-containing protein [Terriglobia bacterium]